MLAEEIRQSAHTAETQLMEAEGENMDAATLIEEAVEKLREAAEIIERQEQAEEVSAFVAEHLIVVNVS